MCSHHLVEIIENAKIWTYMPNIKLVYDILVPDDVFKLQKDDGSGMRKPL